MYVSLNDQDWRADNSSFMHAWMWNVIFQLFQENYNILYQKVFKLRVFTLKIQNNHTKLQ
jgi:hypothetical protein